MHYRTYTTEQAKQWKTLEEKKEAKEAAAKKWRGVVQVWWCRGEGVDLQSAAKKTYIKSGLKVFLTSLILFSANEKLPDIPESLMFYYWCMASTAVNIHVTPSNIGKERKKKKQLAWLFTCFTCCVIISACVNWEKAIKPSHKKQK